MNTAPAPHDCNEEAARLLPWYINGSLAPADAQHVELHLQTCAVCRADAAMLTQLRSVVRSPEQVEHAPHGGLHKLMQRIDGVAASPDLPASPTAPPAAPRRHAGGMLRWLTGAVVLQSVALAVMGTAALRSHEREDAAYRTLTAAPQPAAGGTLRVVFSPSLTLAELQQLLRDQGLRVVTGPSEAGLYTLALQHSQAVAPEAGAVLTRLRADARVRFAEPLNPQVTTP